MLKKIGKILSLGFTVIAVMLLNIVNVSADDYGTLLESGTASGGVGYSLYDSDEDGAGDTVVYSGRGEIIYDYSDVKPTLQYSVKTIIVEEGVKVGDCAFKDCREVTSVLLPKDLTSIGEEAFRECSNLTSIIIPNGVTTIGSNAFRGCDSLTSVTIPDSVTSIGNDALAICISADSPGGNLKEICVSEGNKYYKSIDGVLYTKDGKKLIRCPEGITGKFSISDKVESIEIRAFMGCNNLTSITIPDSVTSIGQYAFLICGRLEEICVSEGNEYYKSVDGILYTKDGKGFILCPMTVDSINILKGVEYIQGCAFDRCSNLTNLIIPDGVITIEGYAFRGCSNLTSIIIPNSVTSIGEYAFKDCKSLTSVTIPEGVLAIKKYAFYGCSSLTSIVIPESVIAIGKYVFLDCNENLVIRGVLGSEAEYYAKENGITFKEYIENALQGINKASDGKWYYYVDGEVDTSYTGFAENSAGKWYVEKGNVTMNATGLYKVNNVWYYVKGSKVQTDFTGIASNASGKWYVEKGIVSLKYNGNVTIGGVTYKVSGSKVTGTVSAEATAELKKVDGVWGYYVNGKLNITYTGIAKNSSGTWYIEKGVVTMKSTGIYKVNNVWYYVKGSKVQTDFTGIASNSSGKWYVEKGIVSLKYNGNVTIGGVTYKVSGSKVTGTVSAESTAELKKVDGVWGYYVNGKLDTSYTGLASNASGNWYVEKGIVTMKATGLYKVNNVWYYVKGSKVQTDFTGIASNSSGKWYVEKGVVTLKYNGNVTIDGTTYKVVNSKVQ